MELQNSAWPQWQRIALNSNAFKHHRDSNLGISVLPKGYERWFSNSKPFLNLSPHFI